MPGAPGPAAATAAVADSRTPAAPAVTARSRVLRIWGSPSAKSFRPNVIVETQKRDASAEHGHRLPAWLPRQRRDWRRVRTGRYRHRSAIWEIARRVGR